MYLLSRLCRSRHNAQGLRALPARSRRAIHRQQLFLRRMNKEDGVQQWP